METISLSYPKTGIRIYIYIYICYSKHIFNVPDLISGQKAANPYFTMLKIC